MRKIPVLLAAALVASVGVFAPPSASPARAAGGVKVAIIVGATHGTTPRYRTYANELYAEAVKYSDNVVRVYSPTATASRVKAAVAGASVVVYLGHGNGWPSPYTFDPNYTTKNGFGLNYDANGDGTTTDYENRYYGEPWIDDLRPAPNAVVLLFHLCYASGNPESGTEPSVSKAKQRVDNYAAAFLKAGARAVVAGGHSHHPYYISALFRTRQTIDQYWRNAPDANDNVAAYASVRTPGSTFQLDPESPGSYYRSIAGTMSLRTEDVTGAPYADTSADPPALVVPGNASPAADGAPVFGSVEAARAGVEPVATLGATSQVHVDVREAVTSAADGSPVYRVRSGDVSGWMTGSSLVPRDSAAPQAWEVDDGSGAFSPDGDGTQDDITVSVRLSERAAWTLRVVDGDGGTLDRAEGSSDTAAIRWAPPAGRVADGAYRWILEATDGWGNGPLRADGSVTVDTAAPGVSVAGDAEAVPQFSPNGDGSGDEVAFAVDATEPGTVAAAVRDAAGDTVDHLAVGVGSAGATLAWDGRRADGTYVPDGEYTLVIAARDRAGNRGEAVTRRVAVFAALAGTDASRDVFFPQDGDALASTTTFSFRLRSAATVAWTIVDATGAVVRTVRDTQALEPGTHAFAWNGRTDAGAMVPRGTYRTVVRATDGTFTATQSAVVTADAFRIAVSDTTPRRGQTLTITAASAETLDAVPRLRVYQPGRDAWSVVMRKVDTRLYRVTITLRSSATGILRLRVGAADDGGRPQASSRSLPLH